MSLLTTTAMGAVWSVPAQAQSASQRTFDIPAQSLPSALTLFGRQSGLQVSVPAALADGRTASAISGTMAPLEALGRLLAGTGLTYRISGNIVTLELAPQTANGAIELGPVRVEGSGGERTGGAVAPAQAIIGNVPPAYAGGQVAMGSQLGLLGNRSVMDTPFNTTSYTEQRVKDAQARSIREVLEDSPSVRANFSEGTTAQSNLMIRGFNITDGDVALNGLYGVFPGTIGSTEIAERVELFEGPSALLNGMSPTGNIGGTINIVSKRAGSDPLTQLTLDYHSDAQFGGAVDIGRRFGSNQQFGIRLNGVYRDGDLGVDRNRQELGFVSAGLDYRSDNVRISADLGYQYNYVRGIIGLLSMYSGLPIPRAPKADDNGLVQPWSYIRNKTVFGAVRAEVDLAEHVTAYAAFGGKHARLDQINNIPALVGDDGALTQNANYGGVYIHTNTGEVGVRAIVTTGFIQHRISIAGSEYWQNYGSAFFLSPETFSDNLYSPVSASRPTTTSFHLSKGSDANNSGVAIADTLSAFDERIQFTVGARWQHVESANYNSSTGVKTTSYHSSAWSPAFAIIVKPARNVSLYANYIEGLQSGSIVGSDYSNAGEVFPPYKSKQYEVGVKVDWGVLATTLNAFQISKPSTISVSGSGTLPTLRLDGEQRNRGIEFNAFGKIARSVRLIGGVMYIDPRLRKTQDGLDDGKLAASISRWQINSAIEWDTPFVPGLTLNSRVVHNSSQYIEYREPYRKISPWTRVDLGARYTVNVGSHPTTIRLDVQNVANTAYWTAGAGYYLTLSNPRTFLLSVTTKF
ncbi:TonB-dependent receptor [Sphingomonas sp. YL-JM2C]